MGVSWSADDRGGEWRSGRKSGEDLQPDAGPPCSSSPRHFALYPVMTQPISSRSHYLSHLSPTLSPTLTLLSLSPLGAPPSRLAVPLLSPLATPPDPMSRSCDGVPCDLRGVTSLWLVVPIIIDDKTYTMCNNRYPTASGAWSTGELELHVRRCILFSRQ